ncbi:MAG: vitamin K epoxide reductase family protein [Rhodothermales bacterium]
MAKKTRKEKEQASRQAAGTAASSAGALSSYRPILDRLVFALGILGIMVTVHLWIQQGRGFDQGCWGFNPPQGGEQLFNCEAVVTSGAGSILGISNVYWGMLFYFGIAVISFLIMRAAPESLALLKRIRAGMIGFGFLYSMYLVNYQINSIGELCALCLTSAAIATTLFGTLVYDWLTEKGSETRLASARKLSGEPRFYAGLALALVVLIGADLAYFNSLPEPPPRVAATPVAPTDAIADDRPLSCVYDSRMADYPNYLNLISPTDPVVGNPDADVVVIEYFDPNCPHCQELHPLMKQMVATHSDSVRFYFIPYPIRDYSVPQIEAMYAANEQGKFTEMVDAQMAMRRTTGINISELRDIAERIGMDVDKMNARLRSNAFRRQIIDQRAKAQDTGMSSVPTVIINGRFMGTRSPGCFAQFVQEAQAAL